MKRVPSAGRWLHWACVIVTTVTLGVACGGSRVDEDESGCEGACERQNGFCPTQRDCEAVCGAAADVTQTSGCDAEYDELVQCLNQLNQCDTSMSLCGASYRACLGVYCTSHPNELFCPK